MKDIIFLITIAIYIFLGLRKPFILYLCCIWVDIFAPELLSYGIVGKIPLSFYSVCFTLLIYVLYDRDFKPRPLSYFRTWLVLCFVTWLTVTLIWAEFPTAAWVKWNWAVKSTLFAVSVPFFIRSRIQLEAFVLTILSSISGDAIARGVKMAISGGGYGVEHGLHHGNSGIAEGATFSAISMSMIPFLLYLAKNSVIFKGRIYRIAFYLSVPLCILAAFDTFERTAVVSAGVLLIFAAWENRTRPLNLAAGAGILFLGYQTILNFLGPAWISRMSTTTDSSEGSSQGRIRVWKWTWDYANSHPFGGGFGVDLGDAAGIHNSTSIAFHSIWFEVLGEQGWVGMAIFLTLILLCFVSLFSNVLRSDAPQELGWLKQFSNALMGCMALYLIGGTFVGIAYQPLLWYLMMASVAASECARRYSLGDLPYVINRPIRQKTSRKPWSTASGSAPLSAGYRTARSTPNRENSPRWRL